MSDILQELSSFAPQTRQAALAQLAVGTAFPPERDWVNMHLHTFFSFNGEGWSPSRVAFEMKKLGLFSAAICDFDVLQGLQEFLDAGDTLALRAAVGLESRVFFSEYGDCDINSPGEPGVFYFMGMGFVKQPEPDTNAARTLASLLERSHARNRALIARINPHLNSFQLDYDNDVLPLTPMGNATERHIVAALNKKAADTLGGTANAAKAWAKLFETDVTQTVTKAENYNAFNDFLRSKLIKRGGIGYETPTRDSFPTLESVISFIRDCRAIPMSAWLDGDSKGEADPQQQLECLTAKGVPAVNIIPDRNWNFKAPDVKARKIKALHKYLQTAAALNMPINVGTECNKPGQRLVDGFDSPELAPFLGTFLKGAKIIIGHTRLLRFADFSYVDKNADNAFSSRAALNDFFASVGALPCPDKVTSSKLSDMSPDSAFAFISDSAAKGTWL